MNIPIQTLHLFPKLDKKLIGLLRSLNPEDWSKPTLAKLWTVKDVAAHLLDGNIRGLTMLRDNHFVENAKEIHSYQELVNFLNQLNADWVKAMKRVSPNVLVEMLELTGKEYGAALTSLDPFKPAMFSVAWAGQKESPNWFHVAREYTEKWHHQQQIREAVNKPAIMTQEFFLPLMDTFMQALPHAYKNMKAAVGTSVTVHVTTEIGGKWSIVRNSDVWSLSTSPISYENEISLDPETAWKLFTKGIDAAEAEKKIKSTGNVELKTPLLSMLAVMA